MQNKLMFFCMISFLVVLFSSCSSSDSIVNQPSIIVGRVYVVGNVPFTKLGLQVSPDKMYILGCDNETEGVLLKHQGQYFKISFKEMEKTAEGISLKVTKAEIVQENQSK